ncbi:MAG: DUF5680 domain-containing protein [Patescibacteria group bacterium]
MHELRDATMAFFFEAMIQGWVGEGVETELPNLPGYKVFRHESADKRLVLVDSYCVSGKSRVPKSVGTTTIWWDDRPVWWMSYGGWYEKEAVPFLKQALLSVYKVGGFIGGRGPASFRDGHMIYVNRPEKCDFSSFKGHEEIIEIASGSTLGEHEYWGMSLIHNW